MTFDGDGFTVAVLVAVAIFIVFFVTAIIAGGAA